jgi:iron complex transport system substrate-binding protein
LEPDLIVGLISDEDNFNKLSTIAPTITPDSQENNPNWKTQFLTSAESVNKVAEAEEKISSIESAYKSVGDKVENIGQMTCNWVSITSQGNIGIGNGSLLELFGLKANQDNSQQGSSSISRENMNQLNADYIGIWIKNEQQEYSAESDPNFQNLPAVQGGNIYWAHTPEASAMNLPSPMALDWLLDKLTPSIEALGR